MQEIQFSKKKLFCINIFVVFSCKYLISKEFILTFHDLVKKYFKGYLKPPFDTEGRTVAGMTEEVIYSQLIWAQNDFL